LAVLCTLAFVVAALGASSAGFVAIAQTATPSLAEARARAFMEALSSGDAAQYEAMARENDAAAFYARRTAAERAAFVAQIASDFGRMQITSVTVNGDSVTVSVRGATGLDGEFVFQFDDTPERKITQVGARLGGDPGGGGVQIPPPPVRPDMQTAEMSAAL